MSYEDVKKVWMNGRMVDFADAKIHAFSHVFHYGSAMFEGARVYKTKQGSAAFRLDDESLHTLYIPRGFLHGFQALTETADTCYRIDAAHDPSEDVAVAFDDPDLGIAWPLPPSIVSDRDRAAGSWADARRLLAPAHA